MESTERLILIKAAQEKGKQSFLYNKLRPKATRTTARTTEEGRAWGPRGHGPQLD